MCESLSSVCSVQKVASCVCVHFMVRGLHGACVGAHTYQHHTRLTSPPSPLISLHHSCSKSFCQAGLSRLRSPTLPSWMSFSMPTLTTRSASQRPTDLQGSYLKTCAFLVAICTQLARCLIKSGPIEASFRHTTNTNYRIRRAPFTPLHTRNIWLANHDKFKFMAKQSSPRAKRIELRL